MNTTVQQSRATAPLRKNILQEYLPLGGVGVDGRCNFRASPTDLLMTPCTAKLHAHKQMRYSKYTPLNEDVS